MHTSETQILLYKLLRTAGYYTNLDDVNEMSVAEVLSMVLPELEAKGVGNAKLDESLVEGIVKSKVNEMFSDAVKYFNLSSGDIEPAKALELDNIEASMVDILDNFVKGNTTEKDMLQEFHVTLTYTDCTSVNASSIEEAEEIARDIFEESLSVKDIVRGSDFDTEKGGPVCN